VSFKAEFDGGLSQIVACFYCKTGGNKENVANMRGRIVVLLILWLAFLRPASATTQLIVNGAFDSATYAPWQSGGTVGVQFAAGYVSMGNENDAFQWVYQTITFPTNLIGATLSVANETLSTDPNGDDTFSIYLDDTGLNPLQQLGTTITSANPTDGWAYGSTNFITYAGSNILSSYAGQTVNLLFYVTTDATYGDLTSFFVTDVSVVAGTTADIPSNDDFTNATVIPADGITNDDVTTTYASRENGEPYIAGNPGGHSLWWAWTAPAIGTVTINTAVSDFNTLLGVYTGTALTNLTVVTNSDGEKLASGVASVKFIVSQGTQYQITLDGYNGQSGNADFVFTYAPDKTPPTVAITSPASGADVPSSTIIVKGTANDNVAVASVWYQLENANGTNAWQLATGMKTWSATVTNLIPGPNTVRVEAYDTSTNVSAIVSRVFNYISSVPLTLTIVGEGTVSGATNGQPLHVGYPYTLTARAASGFAFTGWTGDISTNTATLKFTVTSNLSLEANFVDIEKPTLSITAPVARQRWSNSVFNVTGKAKDNVGVASVWYQLNTEAWIELANNVNTTNGWTNWNASVTLPPGTNTVKAYAMDAAGNISITNSVSFIYVLSTKLAVQTNGFGTLKPNYNNILLALSNTYTMTATAGKGYVFSNWMSNTGAVATNGPVLKFTMASNLDFTANFVPNPFTAAAGTYEGLFSDTNDVAQASSGFFSALVNENGSFTAKFQQGLKSFPISGQFSLTGGWSGNVKAWDNTAVTLQLDLTGEDVLEGGLTNPVWTAELGASLAVFSKTNFAPQAGNYTLILYGTNTPTLSVGNGFGTVTVSTSGDVKFSGTLGDGTKVTQSAIESAQGQWPLYISLDSGNGMLFGWLTFITNEPDRGIDGQLSWFKPSQAAATLYPAGFTNVMEAAGSAYALTKGEPVLNLTDGYVLLTNGGLTQSITNLFTLAANNVVTGSNKLHLTITTSTGLFSGTTTNAAGKTISFSGAVLQNQSNGFGQFLNAEQSGSVYLAPQP
jgi:uncharacterized repeat protein (TIGR02543 family)